MRYFRLSKLIRDKIPDLMEKAGQKVYGKEVLNQEEYVGELLKKFLEEAKEIDKC